ncbi:hypothetical protein CathTA2_0125 [Caldalkalibacillus thermarum TA2.A1]|uniref:Lrp/AsnC family transcriptional regulator n=1 Tax=Caldalkalibacillus thermarum (strain TA2.A1) TaxID=986075 RepID=F5LBD6_CALTT|nr:Lrp/AsnC family transcriptional regulator [Caldalkalibacillus thermarum]EGL81350.1 hypothetical protein CathTA2_0125 [Caldalkalibacillus thermarum TA2.A1]QZT34559.1 Lrp/AsnC family transcriptional regulator [Caldalkalibacillus thermarum TA2.A1]GGK26790.1 hypothetical protein GCM10010965_19380 [Caldalkalibacillus thermarum]
MLSDIERKILRIIENHIISKGVPPGYRQLARFTGRSESEVRRIVLKLKQEGKLQLGERKATGRWNVKTDKWTMEDSQNFIWYELH